MNVYYIITGFIIEKKNNTNGVRADEADMDETTENRIENIDHHHHTAFDELGIPVIDIEDHIDNNKGIRNIYMISTKKLLLLIKTEEANM